jgi:hypothetical protein
MGYGETYTDAWDMTQTKTRMGRTKTNNFRRQAME